VGFFQRRHQDDLQRFKAGDAGWTLLRCFGERVQPGDVVITFNYDASLERVLLEQGKWNPSDGYGLGAITLVSRGSAARCLPSRPSTVPIFHLHGSFGWYTNFSLSSPKFQEAPEDILLIPGGITPNSLSSYWEQPQQLVSPRLQGSRFRRLFEC
jgi:hypothetical protein